APLGMDAVIARRGLCLDAPRRRATLGASVLTALAAAATAAVLYGLSPLLSACILAATVAGGVTQSAAAYFQGKSRFGIAVPLLQAANWALVPIAGVTAWLAIDDANAPALMITAAALLTAFGARALAQREPQVHVTGTDLSGLWA